MNRLIYFLTLIVMVTVTANAQEPFKRKNHDRRKAIHSIRMKRESLNPEKRADRTSALMQKRLDLNNEQRQKIRGIELNRIKKNEEWRKENAKIRRDRVKKHRAFMKSNREKVDRVLTEEQRMKLNTSRSHIKERAKDRIKKRPGRALDSIPHHPKN